MTIAFIQPNGVMLDDQLSPGVNSLCRDAHRYCRDSGQTSYLMAYDIQTGRGIFVVNPLDRPVLVELRHDGGKWRGM